MAIKGANSDYSPVVPTLLKPPQTNTPKLTTPCGFRWYMSVKIWHMLIVLPEGIKQTVLEVG